MENFIFCSVEEYLKQIKVKENIVGFAVLTTQNHNFFNAKCFGSTYSYRKSLE